MKFNKVVYLRYFPLTNKIVKDFYMLEVLKNNIEVEYWDLTSIYFRNFQITEDFSDSILVRKFFKYSDVEFAIKSDNNISKVLFISIMSFEGRVFKLHLILSKYNCKIGVFGRNMFPVPSYSFSFFSIMSKINIESVFNFLLTKIALFSIKVGFMKNYYVVFIAGAYGWQGIGRINEKILDKVLKIKVNSDDYDDYLDSKELISVDINKHILFLDEYLPFHPDTVLFKIKNINPENYYPLLNRYFDRVEEQFGLPVVIAAHPKASLYKDNNFFNGRKVYFNQTAKLTQNSLFVICHDSTSINYPVSFGKKLHFITCVDIENSINSVHRNVIHISKYLGSNFQYIDDFHSKIDVVDKLPFKNYNEFKYCFQTSLETEFTPTSEIFIKFLTN